MTRYRYRPVKQLLSDPDLGGYTTYGIHVFIHTPSGRVQSTLLHDISCDPNFVDTLAEACTRLQLDPCHLLNVVLDALP